MKLLVTGGAGFIGANFIHYILNKYSDYKIVNLDILSYAGNLANLKSIENNSNYKFVKGDITDSELVNKLIQDTDIIINFAAESHVDRSILDSGSFIKTNIVGTHVLLEAAKKYNKRFHHISTDEVFGSLNLKDDPFDENSSYDPRSPYSACKASSDHLVRAYYHTYGLSITISNCSNNYGPYQFPEKLIPLFVTNLIESKKVPVYGKGENIRDWIHVNDHCRAIDVIIHRGKIGGTYCVGGDSELTNMQITRKILNLMNMGDEMIMFVKDRLGHDIRYAINSTKIKNDLGWEPEIRFDEGLLSTVNWYKDNKDWWQTIKDGSYKDYYNNQYR